MDWRAEINKYLKARYPCNSTCKRARDEEIQLREKRRREIELKIRGKTDKQIKTIMAKYATCKENTGGAQ
jgi:hypothetical protein